ncbi:unnamed protein product [Durusdinium trenchii]|uniref:Uncharacterized protein n=1 Tax=Durusdinium trenchii TaxID=1381693 RepID=A0ABP0HE96_9DINO
MNRSGSWSFRDWARSWAAGVHCDNHWCEGTVSHTKFGCVLSAANDIVPHGKDNCSFDGHHMSVQDVQLFDMVLTSSARLLVLTGDVNYRDSYFMKIEPLEEALRGIELNAPEISAKFNDLTVVANDKLIEIEVAALDTIGSNQSAAIAMLFSDEYQHNKELLLNGVAILDSLIQESRESHDATQAWWGWVSTSVVLAAFVSEVMLLVVVHRLDRRLELLALESDVHQNRYELLMRKELMNTAVATFKLLQISRTRASLERQLSVPNIKEDKTPRLIMRRRLFVLSMMAEGLALSGFAIPATLTLIALNNAAAAEPIEQLLLYAKSTEYYDMALTTSAQLCVLTGDTSWSELYDGYVAPMDGALLGLAEVAPGISDSFAASTSAANSVLIDMETVALGHCGQNNEQGKSILFGSAYSGNKTILLDGIKDVTQAAEQALKDHEDHKENHSSMARVLLIISTFLIVSADLCTVVIAAWMEALSVTHHKDMKDSEDESKFMKKLLSMIQSALAANAEAGDNQKMESSQANQREAPELDEDDELDFVKIAMSI